MRLTVSYLCSIGGSYLLHNKWYLEWYNFVYYLLMYRNNVVSEIKSIWIFKNLKFYFCFNFNIEKIFLTQYSIKFMFKERKLTNFMKKAIANFSYYFFKVWILWLERHKINIYIASVFSYYYYICTLIFSRVYTELLFIFLEA